MPIAARHLLFAGFCVLVGSPCQARIWTDVDGRKIEAELLEPGKHEVTLQLVNGQTTKVPVTRLSTADQAYLNKVTREQPKPHGVPITGTISRCMGFDAYWPSASQCSLDLKIDVVSEDKQAQKFVYQSAHYQFVCNAQLRPSVVAAMASLFEGTHELLRVLPLNNRLTATPTKLRVFLFDSMAGYYATGAPPGTAGVCIGSGANAVILVPLESLGVRKIPNKDEFGVDPKHTNKVLAHELTHALMEDQVKAAAWYIEGSAEYVRLTPFAAGRYRISDNSAAIIEGVTAFGKKKDGGRNLGKSPELPPLEMFMSLPYPRFVANPQFNYGVATLLTYYFYHLDGRGDAARIKGYVKALQDGAKENIAREHLLDGRSWPQLEADFTAAMAKLGVKVKFKG